jgi:hypothetical protein
MNSTIFWDMWRHVVHWKWTEVSEEHISILRADFANCFFVSTLSNLFFDPEDWGDILPLNIRLLLTDYSALHNIS